MSIKHSLLALLTEQPMYGAQLKNEFELRTGGTWPLNVGQVYTTLSRLERDGLVEHAGEPDADGRSPYRLTRAGRSLVDGWWQTPVDREAAPRSELAIKLALAVTVPGVDVAAVVQSQRSATLQQLQDLTRLKRRQHPAGSVAPGQASGELAWSLVLEHLSFAAEAEIRWLDHVESTLSREAAARPRLRQIRDSVDSDHDGDRSQGNTRDEKTGVGVPSDGKLSAQDSNARLGAGS